MLRPEDDGRHNLAGPLARESLFFTAPLAEEGLSVFVYAWVNGEDRAGRVVSVFGDGGRSALFDRRDGIDAGGRGFDDWTIGGLRLRHLEPLSVAELEYAGAGVAFEMRFEALHRAFAYSENAAGCPPCMGEDRFEQSGRVRGRLRVEGRTIDFDGTGHRDHSWGTRDYDAIHHFKWISAQAGAGFALNAFQILWSGEQTIHGYVFRDGELAPVVAMASEVAYDERFAPRRIVSSVRDAAGREVAVEAERFSHLRWEAPPIVMDDLGCRSRLDGHAGVAHVGLAWTAPFVAKQVERRR